MEQRTFEKFRQLVYKESGIFLAEHKAPLLDSRIAKRLRSLGLSGPEEYLRIIEIDRDLNELAHLIDAISTNVTHFFRENGHFQMLQGVFSQWREERRKKVRVWCAASSSGEEPYSIAITAAEYLDLNVTDFRLLATDICTPVLHHAARGFYEPKRVDKIESALLKKYFKQGKVDGELGWQVAPSVRELVVFKRLNLSNFPYPLKNQLDIIFCRNVMIYFDLELRTKIVEEFSRLLCPRGLLFIGHSESLTEIKSKFERIGVAAYRL